MRIAIFGLGYVGSVSAACLAHAGHHVVGVDVDGQKVSAIREGRSPVVEPQLDEWLARAVAAGQLEATDRTPDAVRTADLSLICVGTPSRRNGSLDSGYLERVVTQIGHALADIDRYHVVAIRSTLLPGVVTSTLVPMLESASRRRVGEDIGLCVNPEFLREGSAIRDFQSPPFTVIGESDSRAGDLLLKAYAHLQAPVHRLRLDEASMVKYASNAYHALKVAFANEIGALSGQLGIDGRRVMATFCEDHDLNISPRYLMPGFGFGGSCLPKDLRALNYVAKDHDISTPLLGSVMASNDAHIGRVIETVLESGKRKVTMLGLSFKNGSDDLRESPFVTLAENLLGKGVALTVCDPDVNVSKLIGRNRTYIEERLPHLAKLMTGDWESAVRDADVVIVGKRWDADLPPMLDARQLVIDLVGTAGLESAVRPWAKARGALDGARA